MIEQTPSEPAGSDDARRVFYFNAGFLRQKRIRRILDLAGLPLNLGKPGPEDLIAVWGRSPYAARGEAMAARTGAGLVRVEDAFLRSLHPGRAGEPPLGLLIDRTGVHFDSSAPSDLETLLATHPLDDTALMDRARGCIARMTEAHLSKYTAFDPAAPCPDPGYVLVLDQTRGDASVTHGGADANTFREMLYHAQADNPGCPVLIKTHPETAQGHREGYFGPGDTSDRVTLFSSAVSPWALMEGAVAVYAVTSQLGFEAIFAGHKPHVFGQPFYAGWGLTEDRHPHALPRRRRNLSRAQLFAAAMLLYPAWYDPHRDRLCELEDAISILEARTKAWRQDHAGWVASGMRLWKRKPLQQIFGAEKRMIFKDDPARAAEVAAATGRTHMCWAGKAPADAPVVRVEDGFLRSRGLGAELVPPLSLVCDDLGIYYDPKSESRLERWIARRSTLRPDQDLRAERLINHLVALGLSKYNLGLSVPDLPKGQRVLVPGQVEDDASIRTGAHQVTSNLALLEAAHAAYPDAILLYKPHPDVESGLRDGTVPQAELERLGAVVLPHTDPAGLLTQVQRVFTMTSLLGFEALLRHVPVTTTGAPFYAGWGLTKDLGQVPARRAARPTLNGFVHAALIDYPRYFDPVTGQPCPVEVVLDRLAAGDIPHPGPANRLLFKLQGVFASYAGLWR
ncbi:Capsule polysaccharide biosynthesis protein [Roseovarius sp. THAF27]|uniref:capsular polysaccharide biosynthesis protein n=1 Tax=Roseovarius sp. THAF27 TaxID=2587850 RepID=UPI001268FA40|nr:capsular polysaccharide biosynthesis protein [Roseovarius sp. THAF27]QFT81831.1 Capsule polysaccharide biosynthesis protein [Roseovarius sp. THAF27]